MLPFAPARFGNFAAMGGGITYLPHLDAVAAKCIAAWGLHRLFTGVSEAVNVRAVGGVNDASATDIGTLATGDFDAASFLTWVDGGSGYAPIWYDQKGSINAIHATAGNQPQIVQSSIASKYALRFSGSNNLATSAQSWTGIWAAGFECWAVVRPSSVAARSTIMARGSYDPAIFMRTNASAKVGVYSGAHYVFDTTLTANTDYLIRVYYHSGTWYCDINGTQEATTHTVAAPPTSGAVINVGSEDGTSAKLTADMPLLLLFNSALTVGEASTLANAVGNYFQMSWVP